MQKSSTRQEKLLQLPTYLNFERLDEVLSLSLRNIASTRVWYRIFLTNPDNYVMDQQCAVLAVKGAVTVRVGIRHNDSLSSFNYIKNKLLVMSLPLGDSIELEQHQLRHYYVGHPTAEVVVNQVRIIVDSLGFRKLNEVTLHYLRKHIKIMQYSECELDRKEYEFIRNYCCTLGELEGISLTRGFLHASFIKPIEHFEPRLMVMKGDKDQLLAVFSLSYFSTFMGKQRAIQRPPQPPPLKLCFQMQVAPQIQDMLSFEDIVVCRTATRLLIYNVKTHQSHGFEHQDFKVALFPPYLCVVMEKKYLIFYENFQNIQITRIKVKKLLVKCFFKFNNNLYVAGRNCTKVPLLKPTTNRREIYVAKNFTLAMAYVVPDSTIPLPESVSDVSVMLGQNPHLFVYCQPSIHLISLRTNEIVTTLNRQLATVQLLQGRYANSLVSAIGITHSGMFIRINFEKFSTVYGVEVNESNQPTTSLCQAKDGRVFLSNGQSLFEFHAKKLRVLSEQRVTDKGEKVHLIRTNTKGDIVLLKQTTEQWIVEFYKQT